MFTFCPLLCFGGFKWIFLKTFLLFPHSLIFTHDLMCLMDNLSTVYFSRDEWSINDEHVRHWNTARSHSCTAPSEWTSHFPAVKDIPNLCQSMLTLTSSQSLSSVNVRLSLSQDRTNEGSAECVIWSDQPNFEILWKERLIITYLCWLCLLFLPSWALFPFQKKKKDL